MGKREKRKINIFCSGMLMVFFNRFTVGEYCNTPLQKIYFDHRPTTLEQSSEDINRLWQNR
jgi:hypothetical protein